MLPAPVSFQRRGGILNHSPRSFSKLLRAPARLTNLGALVLSSLLTFSLLLNFRSFYHDSPTIQNAAPLLRSIVEALPEQRPSALSGLDHLVIVPGAMRFGLERVGRMRRWKIRGFLLRTRRDAGVRPFSVRIYLEGEHAPCSKFLSLTRPRFPNQLSNRYRRPSSSPCLQRVRSFETPMAFTTTHAQSCPVLLGVTHLHSVRRPRANHTCASRVRRVFSRLRICSRE